jgi:hypothetical protein
MAATGSGPGQFMQGRGELAAGIRVAPGAVVSQGRVGCRPEFAAVDGTLAGPGDGLRVPRAGMGVSSRAACDGTALPRGDSGWDARINVEVLMHTRSRQDPGHPRRGARPGAASRRAGRG